MPPRSSIQLQQSDFVHMGIIFLSFEYVDIYASYSNISVVQNKKKWLTYCHCFFSWQFFHLNLVQKKTEFLFFEKIENFHLGSSQLICWRCDPCPNPHDNSSALVTAVNCTSTQIYCAVRLN
jgi:hypothetical protein